MASTMYPSRRRASCTPAQSPCSSSTTSILTFDLSIASRLSVFAVQTASFHLLQRQLHRHHRPARSPVARLQVAPMRRHDLLRNPQAEATPLSLRREIPAKERRQLFRWNARPIIAYNHRIPPIRHAGAHLNAAGPLHLLDPT